MATMALSLLEVVRTVAANLGYTSIKPEQESAFLRGNDVFVSLSMGYGKSLCYNVCSSSNSGRALIHQ